MASSSILVLYLMWASSLIGIRLWSDVKLFFLNRCCLWIQFVMVPLGCAKCRRIDGGRRMLHVYYVYILILNKVNFYYL